MVAAVKRGLLQSAPWQRSMPSQFFYDDEGSALYERITQTDDYYLTRCEAEIFAERADDILDIAAGIRRTDVDAAAPSAASPSDVVSLIDLGAGDGRKTLVLLQRAVQRGLRVCYVPVDISEKAMVSCAERVMPAMEKALMREKRPLGAAPSFMFRGLVGDFFECLEYLFDEDTAAERRVNGMRVDAWDRAVDGTADDRLRHRIMVTFIGSSIGNLDIASSIQFCRRMRTLLRRGVDHCLIGFDLRKSHHLMQRAYSDREGITAEFNRNLLRRMNRELGADFDADRFEHYAQFSVERGVMESYLVATQPMRVTFRHLEAEEGSNERATSAPSTARVPAVLELRAWEAIHTENSAKYTIEQIEQMARGAGFEGAIAHLSDSRHWFVDSVRVGSDGAIECGYECRALRAADRSAPHIGPESSACTFTDDTERRCGKPAFRAGNRSASHAVQ
eukprot:ctg_148.g115